MNGGNNGGQVKTGGVDLRNISIVEVMTNVFKIVAVIDIWMENNKENRGRVPLYLLDARDKFEAALECLKRHVAVERAAKEDVGGDNTKPTNVDPESGDDASAARGAVEPAPA